MVSERDRAGVHERGIPLRIVAGEATTDMEDAQGLLRGAEATALPEGGLREPTDAETGTRHDGGGESFDISRVMLLLYCSHFFSRWGDRMWEFAVALLMVEVWPDSLLLAALYGLTESGALAAFGVLVGTWVDSNPRLKVVKVALTVQNSCVTAAALAVLLLLANPRQPQHIKNNNNSTGAWQQSRPSSSAPLSLVLVALINILGGVAALAGLAGSIAVERDWVVVVAEGQPSEVLPKMNATMRRIDLCCKLLAPIAVGALMSLTSPASAAIAIASWNLLSFGAELSLLLRVHASVPALAFRHPSSSSSSTDKSIKCTSMDKDAGKAEEEGTAQLLPQPPEMEERRVTASDNLGGGRATGLVARLGGCMQGVMQTAKEARLGWRVYAMQEVFLAAVALACLYLTVISFGTLMTAWLGWQRVPTVVLGAVRGLAAAVGIGATLLYPILQSRLSTVRTGLWAIWMQWTMLVPCVVAVFVHSANVSSALLIGGVIASRLGLWMFDLSVTQLMQESVPEGERGVVGGVQSAVQELMELASFACGILLPRPQDFGLLVLLSFGMISLAACLYSRYSFIARGHLWHFEKMRPLLLSSHRTPS